MRVLCARLVFSGWRRPRSCFVGCELLLKFYPFVVSIRDRARNNLKDIGGFGELAHCLRVIELDVGGVPYDLSEVPAFGYERLELLGVSRW